MDAEEARRITRTNLEGPVIAPLLRAAYARITLAAEEGKRSVNHPFYNVAPFPTSEAEEAALKYLESEGYKVTHHANPDPGSPGSGPYDEVSW